jgi:type VI secretion system protein ImpH
VALSGNRRPVELPFQDLSRWTDLELGITAIAGSKVWDVQGKLRARIGPLNFQQFSDFLPEGLRFRPLCQLTRLSVGPEFDFDVQLVLKANEVPWCQFTSDPANAPRLGWNTWIRSNEFSCDVDDAVFVSTNFDI